MKAASTVLLAGLLTGVTDRLFAQEPSVTQLLTKALADIPGREVLMLTVE